jgi:hypothetical protein
MRSRSIVVVTWLCTAGAAALVAAPQFTPDTARAFDRYIQVTELRQREEIEGRSPFLWLDRQPASGTKASYVRKLNAGGVVSAPLETRDNGRTMGSGNGTIHHWVGTVLMPGVKLDRVIAFVQQYERYPEIFTPMIQRARIIAKSPTRFDVAMRTFSGKYGVNATYDGDYGVDYRSLGPTRMFTRSVATNLYHIDGAGTPAEKRVPAEQASRGYLWRLNTYCSFDERPEGTYEQCEAISMSETPGFFVRLAFSWAYKDVPVDTLTETLGRVRAGLVKAGPGK